MAGWPSPAERRALDAFPEQIGPEDVDEHFTLSPTDLRFALELRIAAANRAATNA